MWYTILKVLLNSNLTLYVSRYKVYVCCTFDRLVWMGKHQVTKYLTNAVSVSLYQICCGSHSCQDYCIHIIAIAGDSLMVASAQYQLSSAQGKLSGDTLLHEKLKKIFFEYCVPRYNWFGTIKIVVRFDSNRSFKLKFNPMAKKTYKIKYFSEMKKI